MATHKLFSSRWTQLFFPHFFYCSWWALKWAICIHWLSSLPCCCCWPKSLIAPKNLLLWLSSVFWRVLHCVATYKSRKIVTFFLVAIFADFLWVKKWAFCPLCRCLISDLIFIYLSPTEGFTPTFHKYWGLYLIDPEPSAHTASPR